MKQRGRRTLWIGLLALALFAVFLMLIWPAWFYQWPWTGFGASTSPPGTTRIYQREKTLWDLLQLIVVPVVLALVGYWLNRRDQSRADDLKRQQSMIEAQHQHEHQLAEYHEQDGVLNTYLERMADLLSSRGYNPRVDWEESIKQVARVSTLTTLRRIDGERKGILLGFLYDSNLIRQDNTIIPLYKADIRNADLRNIDLRGAKLEEATLDGANLSMANLEAIDLSRTDLSRADLRGADLRGASLKLAKLCDARMDESDLRQCDLAGAKLCQANLSDANLEGAYLNQADLSGAIVTEEQLAQAASLAGATMPDGTRHL